MDEIGELLRATRVDAGVSLEEASGDLEIKPLILQNIEEGNIGCFKDIFILKDYIYNYAKYLGLNPDETIDKFNEYLFEYTSKIPIKDIEKAIKEQQKDDTVTNKIVSPYTASTKESNTVLVTILIVALVLLVVIVIIWSIKHIGASNAASGMVSYLNSNR